LARDLELPLFNELCGIEYARGHRLPDRACHYPRAAKELRAYFWLISLLYLHSAQRCRIPARTEDCQAREPVSGPAEWGAPYWEGRRDCGLVPVVGVASIDDRTQPTLAVINEHDTTSV
jgi:hypothetical protein